MVNDDHGRPPIPIAKEIHDEIEGQNSTCAEQDEVMRVLYPFKRKGNHSWVMLKLGCELLSGIGNTDRNGNVQSKSKAFARQASDAIQLNFHDLLNWIEDNSLGEWQ